MSRRLPVRALSLAALATSVAVAPVAQGKQKCDSNYKGRCLKPNVSDYDCAGGSGNGPYYVSGPFRVVGNDHYRLDADHDGIACES
jgi:Excalibur calcium-binding domain